MELRPHHQVGPADGTGAQRPTIGVLFGWQVHNGHLDTYVESVFSGVIAAAREASCNLLVGCGVGTLETSATAAWPIVGPSRVFVPVGPWNTDGLVVINPLVSDETAEDAQRFQADGHPVVFLNRGQEGPTVAPDNAGGIEQAVAHLAAHGHRRIAFLRCLSGDGPERLAAYRAAVSRYGLDSDPALLYDGRHWKRGGADGIAFWTREGVEFTAVLASNDASARGALLRLEEAGDGCQRMWPSSASTTRSRRSRPILR